MDVFARIPDPARAALPGAGAGAIYFWNLAKELKISDTAPRLLGEMEGSIEFCRVSLSRILNVSLKHFPLGKCRISSQHPWTVLRTYVCM